MDVAAPGPVSLSVPLGSVGLHYRGGSIVPLQRYANVTRDVRFSPITLLVALPSAVHAGNGSSSSTSGSGSGSGSGINNNNLNTLADLSAPPTFDKFVSQVAASANKYSEITDAQKDVYNPEVSNDITPKLFMAPGGVIVYDYFPVPIPSNPNAESIFMIASPKVTGKDPADTIVEILTRNKDIFIPGNTGINANMPGPQVAGLMEKTIKDSLSTPSSLLVTANKVFEKLPAPFLSKFSQVRAQTAAAATAAATAKKMYDSEIAKLNNTPGIVSGGGS